MRRQDQITYDHHSSGKFDIASCPENPRSPRVSSALWTGITFVNFRLRRYLNADIFTVQELQMLRKLGYSSIDTPIADAIMRLNSTPGVSTSVCCSGHPGSYRDGYIGFTGIVPGMLAALEKSKYWKRDMSPCSSATVIFRLDHVKGPQDWLRAMLELHQIPGLAGNAFVEYRMYREKVPGGTGKKIVVCPKHC